MDTVLDVSLDARHARLRALLDKARSAPHSEVGSRDRVRETDMFLAAASRHLNATSAVLLPLARAHLDDGHDRARTLVASTRLLEVALNLVKAKLYGATFAQHRLWPEVWDQLETPFGRTLDLERTLARDLDAVLDTADAEDVAERLHEAAEHAPTRPHPFLPHQGVGAGTVRAVAAKVDSFWDTAEGRLFPEPPHPPHRTGSKLEQYLLGDPTFDEELEDEVDQEGVAEIDAEVDPDAQRS